jgi:transposase-like protein
MSVLSVEVAAGEVEAMIERGVGPALPGGARCPECGGELRLWPQTGYLRFVRRGGVTSRMWLRRAVCVGGCGRTHALRPSFLLGWRRDVVAVIGWALAEAAEGAGHRRVAGLVGVHETTVRSWLVRLRAGAERWRWRFLALAVELGAELARAPPECASPRLLLALLEALTVAYAAACERFGAPPSDGLWGFCSRFSAGRLIAPGRRT